MKAVGHSLWLVPEPEARRALAGLIVRLARDLGTPAFEPHLTLLGGIAGGAEDAAATAAALAGRIPCFTLRFSGTTMRDEYLRALVLEVEPSVELLRARRLAVEASGTGARGRFEPHLSLLYGDVPKSSKHAALARAGPVDVRSCDVRALEVVRTEGAVAEWRVVARLRLAG
jgi:2'-5' RNA ligase